MAFARYNSKNLCIQCICGCKNCFFLFYGNFFRYFPLEIAFLVIFDLARDGIAKSSAHLTTSFLESLGALTLIKNPVGCTSLTITIKLNAKKLRQSDGLYW